MNGHSNLFNHEQVAEGNDIERSSFSSQGKVLCSNIPVAQSRRALCTVCAVTHYLLFVALLVEMLWAMQAEGDLLGRDSAVQCQLGCIKAHYCLVKALVCEATHWNSNQTPHSAELLWFAGRYILGYYLLSQCRNQWLGFYWHK